MSTEDRITDRQSVEREMIYDQGSFESPKSFAFAYSNVHFPHNNISRRMPADL